MVALPSSITLSWEEAVDTRTSLPIKATFSETRFVEDESAIYIFLGEGWTQLGGVDFKCDKGVTWGTGKSKIQI